MKQIFSRLEEFKKTSTRWFKARAHGPHAKAWLFVLSFSEASFFVIPPDVLLIAILMTGASRWIEYAAFTTIASVTGGIFGYFIGLFFFDTIGVGIIEFYHVADELKEVQLLFNNNAFLVIFIAAFTPIPYKIFVLSAGFLKINFLAFVIASFVGRGLRYFVVAYITKVFGGKITRIFMRHFNSITLIAAAVFGLFLLWSLFQ